MDTFSDLIQTLDTVLDTARKRQIIGGIMMSVALLFGGLAITVMTIKEEDELR